MGVVGQIEELFMDWAKDDCFAKTGELGQFVPDGIVDYEMFETAERKVLFVLRDPHDKDNKYGKRGICDEVLYSHNSGRTWNPIAIWARALLNDLSSFNSINTLGKEEIQKCLRRVAIMNLKKASGGSSAQEVQEYTERHSNWIFKEIQLINPDIIIACGHDVYNLLVENVFELEMNSVTKKVILNEKMKNYGHIIDVSKAIKTDTPTFLVHYRHPNRCTVSGNYETHYNNMKEIRKEIDRMILL